jgi:biopolymer transport protein ExbB
MHYVRQFICITLIMIGIFGAGPVVIAQSEGPEAATERAHASAGESFLGAFFVSRVTNAAGEKSLDIFGSILLWLLLTLSVLSVGLIGMMALTNQRKAYVPEGVVAQVKRMMTAGQFRQVIELTSAERSFFSQVLHIALREAAHGYSAVIRSLEQASDELATIRLRRVEYLNILAQVSPMIGLFGTVWGMILAFHAIVMAGGNADPVLLAGGIGTALTTTFWGLIIAIPALAAYAIIRNRIDEFTTEATRAAEELLNEFRPKSATAAGTATAPSASQVAKPHTEGKAPEALGSRQ